MIFIQAASPSSGRFTALGFYLLISIFFVVIGMIQFAFVLHLHQYNQKELFEDKGKRRKSLKKNLLWYDNVGYVSQNENRKFNIRKIDNIAFNVVGTLFIVFNLLYWTIFMTFSFDYGRNI